MATDALGGSAEATTSAAVAPTGLAGAALANLTTGLLDAAFSLGSGEGICQTVVAAAAAASGDVALTSTLVDAVGAVASGVDADAALVEQTSSSLLAAANNGSGLAESAATSALAAAGALANASAGVGITAVAAATLGDSLSSLLESSLFDAYAAPANASNASRRLAASAGVDVGVTLDAVARAQKSAATELSTSASILGIAVRPRGLVVQNCICPCKRAPTRTLIQQNVLQDALLVRLSMDVYVLKDALLA